MFDTVAEDPKGYIFYESKFRKEPLSLALIRQEIQQVQATGLNCCKFYIPLRFPVQTGRSYDLYPYGRAVCVNPENRMRTLIIFFSEEERTGQRDFCKVCK